MIDLHVHTNCSDGSDTVIDVLKKAEEAKLEYLSITDHNNCNAYNNINMKDYYSGTVINGIELSTGINGTVIELLGYGIDTNFMNAITNEMYLSFEEIELTELNKQYNIFKNMGMKFDEGVLERYTPSNGYASTYLLGEINKYEENEKYMDDKVAMKDSTVFYRKHMSNPNSVFYTNKTELLPSPDKVVQAIKDAGGLVFIPHIYMYGDVSNSILESLIKNHDIDGIECYHSSFTEEQIKTLLEYAGQNNLYISGGSDYHGDIKPDINIGTGKGNLNIPRDILDDWKDKVLR